MEIQTYSQNGEELIIQSMLDIVTKKGGQTNNFLVELGAGDGYHLSNSRFFIDKGWKSILIDADNRGNTNVKEHKITRENINSLLKQYKCPKDFDFLSIDLDGNDYWIIEEILKEYSPKLIVAEFNAAFGYDCSKTIKYDSEFSWEGDTYFGFTLEAGRKLGEANGYTLMLQHADMNIFLLKNEYAEHQLDEDLPPTTKYFPKITYNKSDFFRKTERIDWVTI